MTITSSRATSIRTIIADTGPLFALVAVRDEHHTEAQAAAARFAAAGWQVAVTLPTLHEAHALVLQRLGVAAARRWIRELLDGIVLVEPTSEDLQVALATVERYADQDISLFDATIAAVSVRTNAPVWTYDHHFDVLRANVWRGGAT